ncbi:MAG: serine/threonine protein kinase, partial [Xanthomonadales bacterium]|nr:serine/threonine protein kinase [Xanthomonadales bacterium]
AGLTRPAAQFAATALAEGEIDAEPEQDEAVNVDPQIGRRVGPYRLTRLLGVGGMGSVYAAERVEGGFRQTVAIKLVSGIHPGLTARFEHERQILADLRHPAIAQLLDGGRTSEGMPYFALEYVEGHSLTDHVRELGLDLGGCIRLLIEVAQALAYAHRRGVIHRDLKPGNILVTTDGHPKLLDFGIAKLLDPTAASTLTHQQIGPMTPAYAAPEQFRGNALGVHTDIYQFGVLLFRLISGRWPYRAEVDDPLAWARAVSEQTPLSLRAVLRQREVSSTERSTDRRSELPVQGGVDLDAVTRRCLAKQPQARYPDMASVIVDLQRWLGGVAGPVVAPPRRWVWPVLGLAAALSMAGAGWWAVSRPESAALESVRWDEHPALLAFGLQPNNLHASRPETEGLVRRALLAEAQGDGPAAMALLETAHRTDAETPVPAVLVAYWGSSHLGEEAAKGWLAEGRQRLQHLDDPYLDLFAGFVEADAFGNAQDSLRQSAALLALQPRAWFLHYARAHAYTRLDLPAAALREIQAIDVPADGHRRLLDVIADRASLGDPEGAWALWETLPAAPDNPQREALRARLTYSSGDLAGARAAYRSAVARARAVGRRDIEARGLLWAGAFGVALGDDDAGAAADLNAARSRLVGRSQYGYAVDAAILLAHLASWRGDRPTMLAQLSEAQALRAEQRPNPPGGILDLVAARLAGTPIPSLASEDEDYPQALPALLAARAALQAGDRATALSQLELARATGIGTSTYLEEAALLARELQAAEFELPPIDPPFGPYGRFAARRELGAGGSVVPARRTVPP